MEHKVNAVFSGDKHGYYVYCPELPGCHSQGDTLEEAKVNIKEAIDLYVGTMNKGELETLFIHKI